MARWAWAGQGRTFNCGASLTNQCIFLTEMRIPSTGSYLAKERKRDEKAWSPLQLQEKHAVDAPTALYVDGPEALVDPVSKAARALSVFLQVFS
ncbi:hypothetical protein TWF569_001881 [Orbilia oligospora]|nr:hypothetical protein TWF569_001881 [Orbilia oligospora]